MVSYLLNTLVHRETIDARDSKNSNVDKVNLQKCVVCGYDSATYSVVFLGFWVLQISVYLISRQWTSQIVILILGYLSIRYLCILLNLKGYRIRILASP